MAARKKSDNTFLILQKLKKPLSSLHDILRRFSFRSALLKDVPGWIFLVNFRRCETLIGAVVPLCQIRRDLRLKFCKSARLLCSFQRAAKNFPKKNHLKPQTQKPNLFL